MKRIKVTVAALLAIAILLGGCQTTDTSWAFELEGERMSAGAYILFMNQAVLEAMDLLHEEWMDWEPAYEGQEFPQHPLDMPGDEIGNAIVEGMRLYDWVVLEAQVLARRHFAIHAKLAQLGVALAPYEISQANASAAATYRQNEQMLRDIGVAEHSLALVNRSNAALRVLFDSLYDVDGAQEVTEQQLRDYFAANYVRVQELVIVKAQTHPWGYETEEQEAESREQVDAENAQWRQQAEEFLARLQAGESIEALQYEHDVERLGTATMAEPGTTYVISHRDHERRFRPAVREGIAALSVGQSGIFEDDDVIAIVSRLDVFEDDTAWQWHRLEMLHNMRYEAYFIPLLDYTAWNLPIITNTAAIARYGPTRILQLT